MRSPDTDNNAGDALKGPLEKLDRTPRGLRGTGVCMAHEEPTVRQKRVDEI